MVSDTVCTDMLVVVRLIQAFRHLFFFNNDYKCKKKNIMLRHFNFIKRFIVVLIVFTYILFDFHILKVFAQNTSSNVIVVDNFENPGKENLLGGDFGAFSDPDNLGKCYLFFSQNKHENVLNESTYSLYIQWDTTKKGAYGGYWSDLKHLNLEDFNYLSFYVKGSHGGEIFKVGLRGKSDAVYEFKININEILIRGVTTEWQKVTIPLKRFKSVNDWHDVNVISINFENTFNSKEGSIILDEFVFGK